jgi:serine/threonine-protein kinase
MMAHAAGSADRVRRVQQIFDAVLDLDQGSRSAFLDNACQGDPDLRREVEDLIGSLERARTTGVLPPLFALAEASLVGKRVHNYRVERLLGAGGMATVFVARHLRIERAAALKVLQPELCGDPGMVQRILNEARAASSIGHPNIVEVIDAGLLDDGRTPYMLMELLHGQSLGQRLRDGGMSSAEAVRIAVETADALASAHDKGIIHRDLKPENIFLVRRASGPDAVKVLDFGIAELRPDVAGASARTQTGAFMGTPEYMSPEQCRNAAAVDLRSDIYSLGTILYEMVCGRTPFRENTGPGHLVYLHLAVAPVPPRGLAADVPEALEAIILQCLAKAPEERFDSMRALMQALRSAVPAAGGTDGAAATTPSTTMEEPGGQVIEGVHPPGQRRRRRWLVASALVMLACATALVIASRRPSSGPDRAATVVGNMQPPSAPHGAMPTPLPSAPATATGQIPAPGGVVPVVSRRKKRAVDPPPARDDKPAGRPDIPEVLKSNPY